MDKCQTAKPRPDREMSKLYKWIPYTRVKRVIYLIMVFTCSDVETFNGFDLDKRLDILVRQYWSAGAYRQDLSFEEFALGETGYLSTLSGNELSDQFSENLDLLKSMGKIEIS